MTAETKSWMEVIEKSYQFYVYLFTIFVVSMGVARWYGKQVGRKREELRRGSGGLPVAAFFSSGTSEQSFTYTSLFQGGLNGVYMGVVLLMYVVLMLGYSNGFAVFTEPSRHQTDIWGGVSILMFYPILMTAFVSLVTIFSFRNHNALPNCWFPIVIVVVGVAGAVAATLLLKDKSIVVMTELFANAVLLLCASYFIGMSEGIRAADPESNYPLVRVELNQGTTFDSVWLYERTDSDYRLVTKNGTNHIIPAVNVKEIRKV